MSEAREIARIILGHEPEVGRREPYCACGAPLGDWGVDTTLHWGEVIVAAGFHRQADAR